MTIKARKPLSCWQPAAREGRAGSPRHAGSCCRRGLAKPKGDRSWPCWASREGCTHLWAWRGLKGWDGGVGAREVGMGVLGAWGKELGVFGPWSRRTGGVVGHGLLEFLRAVTTRALVTMPHASTQGSPTLGLLQLLGSSDGAGSPT